MGALPDKNHGLLDLARAWVNNKATALNQNTQQLQRDAQSHIETVDQPTEDRWQSRKAKRSELETYRDIRQSGGIVSTLLEIRSLMVFGVGGEYQAEEDTVEDWLNDQFGNMDGLLHDIGMDAYTYGYSLAEITETKGGDFGSLAFVQPWTTVPALNKRGDIQSWEQKVEHGRGKHTQTFAPQDLIHFKVMKASGRDPIGMSLLGRALHEAETYRDNQRAIQNAVQMYGFPKFHIKVGPEDGVVIDDNELRRLRPQFDNINEQTKWLTGSDVSIEKIQGEMADFKGLTEHDLSKLAIAFMLPVELTQLGGGEGLGSGFPAKVRERMFLLSADSHQNLLAQQLEDLAGTLITEYAPFSADTSEITFQFNDPITDLEEIKTQVDAIGGDMTVNERREQFDLSPVEDEEGEDYLSPAKQEQADVGGDGIGGLDIDPDGDDEEDGDEGTDEMPEGTEIQEQALNGAQVNAVLDIISTFTDGEMDRSSAIGVILNSFPFLNREQVEEMVPETQNVDPDLSLGQHEAEAAGDEVDPFEWESVVAELYERTWNTDDKALFRFREEGTPDFILKRMREEVLEGGPIFSDLESIDSSRVNELKTFMADRLSEDGWTITELQSEIMDLFDVEERIAETIARSTTQNMVSNAAEEGYKERDDFQELRFDWNGPSDHRTSDVCKEIKRRVENDHGGGMRLDELKDLVQETAKDLDLDPRGWTPHPQCRHRPLRVV